VSAQGKPPYLNGAFIFIPTNALGVASGYYTRDGFVGLLRYFKARPDAVQFLADMLAEGT